MRIPAGRTGWLPVYGEVSDKKGAYWVDEKFNEIDYNDKADEVSAEWDNASFKSYADYDQAEPYFTAVAYK